jgi:hypothetical protein
MNKRLLSLSKAIKSRYSFSPQENFHSGGFSVLSDSKSKFHDKNTAGSDFSLNSSVWSGEIILFNNEILKINLN